MRIEHAGLTEYEQAHQRQLDLVGYLQEDPTLDGVCLMLEHPPVFTLGKNGKPDHIGVPASFLEERQIKLLTVERGGEVTYHGPGQLVCYPIIRLKTYGMSVVEYVGALERIMIDTVGYFGIEAGRDERNRGIWIGDCKLGSIGIAVRRGIAFHGLALNVNPDLTPFSWVNPCGLTNVSITSMKEVLGRDISVAEVREVLTTKFLATFSTGQDAADKDSEKDLSDAVPRRRQAKPGWLKKKLPSGPDYERIRRLVGDTKLHTVCSEAHCPNQFECYGKGTATFMIMGERCTRNCRFCAVGHGTIEPLDDNEPERIAAAVAEMGLDYTVLTSVTRDDLPDGGAHHFVKTIAAIRTRCPDTLVEVLIPDLQGDEAALEAICRIHPAVLNHNVETVESLYSQVRPQAIYERSLELLRRVKRNDPDQVTKSGLMVGLGETRDELVKTMGDIRDAGCELLTIGQYLQPSVEQLPVKLYVPPEEFDELRDIGLQLGFKAVASGPHVRSSYRAGHLFRSIKIT